MTMRDQVLEFMKKHEQDCPERFKICNPDVTLLRVRLIVEEYGELIIALHENDIVKIMDACGDLRYVVVGTAIAYGLPALDIFGTMDRMKADELTNPNPSTKLMYIQRLASRVNTLVLALANSAQMLSFVEERELGRTIREEVDMTLREIAYFDAMYQIPADKVFAEIHRSNMTKNKLDKHSKGGKSGKVGKKGFTPPDFEQFVYRHESA